MRMDKFTSKFQVALADAQSLAVGRGNQFIEPVHVMKALLDQPGGATHHLLTQAGLNASVLRDKLNQAIDGLPQVQGVEGEVHISNDLSKLLNIMDKLAQEHKDAFIASELFI